MRKLTNRELEAVCGGRNYANNNSLNNSNIHQGYLKQSQWLSQVIAGGNGTGGNGGNGGGTNSNGGAGGAGTGGAASNSGNQTGTQTQTATLTIS